MRTKRLFVIICAVVCTALLSAGCSFGPYLTIWGEEPLGISLPAPDDVAVLLRDESDGRDSSQSLWLQFTDEQAAQFESGISATSFWKPLPLPSDIKRFYSENYNFFSTDERDYYYSHLLSVSNGYWMLYNCSEQTHVSRALTVDDTRRFVFAVYDSDTKQLFIDEDRFY